MLVGSLLDCVSLIIKIIRYIEIGSIRTEIIWAFFWRSFFVDSSIITN